MDTIFELCPTLKKMFYLDQIDALVRMCIAHVLNGNEYESIFVTSAKYLEALNEEDTAN